MKRNKILLIFSIITTCFVAFCFWFYLSFLPFVIKQDCVLEKIENITQNLLKLELEIKNPELKTYIRPKIDLNIELLTLKNKNETLVDLENFSISLNFRKILAKKIILDKLSATTLIIKADKLMSYFPQTQEQQSTDWKFQYYNSEIKLDVLNVSYLNNKTLINLIMSDIYFSNEDGYKNLYFNSETIISKSNKEYLDIIASSTDEIKFYKDNIKVEDFNILINNSKLKLNALIDKKNVKINVDSPDFEIVDIFKIIQSDLILPDGETLLKPLDNPSGKVMFKIDSVNQNLSGIILIDNTKAEIKDLSHLPIKIYRGVIEVHPDTIKFVDLKGYWGKNKKNDIKITGDIKDYYKSLDSNIMIDTIVDNEFFKDYLAKLIYNTVLYISKPTKTRIIYKSKNNIMDLIWLAKIPKGTSIGLDKADSKLINYDRAIKGDFHIENNIFDIRNINYYIASDIHKGVKIKPVLTFDGKVGLNGKLDNFGFNFERAIPCEFLNIFTKEKTFKKGTIQGSLHLKYVNDIPKIDSNLEINKTLIPQQRTFIKHAKLSTNNDFIFLDIVGGFKRVKFDFDGKIKNELIAPFIIKDLKLTLDEVNVEKFLESVNSENDNAKISQENIKDENDIKDDNYMFDTNLIRIENSDFKINSGFYKELTFSDIQAKMTLNDKGIIDIKSNKFNIAGGTSSLKVQCDLKNLKHYLKLGIRNVDSNLIAKVLLNLDKEIDGPASGIIELNTDKNLKMNGNIRFLIKDGTIGKIGLVEYLLKVVSIFRNPIAMINPITIMDIISIPSGNFDKIQGELNLKDNVVTKIDIKSYADSLSALIRGRFDMEQHDATLRVYTRFSNAKLSKLNFLRNISLNALANKVQMSTKNDLNYYSSELKDLPDVKIDNNKAQIFLTEIEGDIEHNNFISSLRKIK